MSGSTHQFVSVFRLDDKPILPPLMTNEKRKEMRKYRDQAVRIEHHNMPYADVKIFSKPDGHNFYHRATDKAIQDSYLMLTKLVLNDKDQTEIAERVKKLKKSETIIFDNITNAVIVPLAKDVVTTAIPVININPPTPQTRRSFAESIKMNSENNSECAATDLQLTLPKRSATSPALNQLSLFETKPNLYNNEHYKEQPTLVRSNSFTLETPSRALVEHMRQQDLQEKRLKFTTTPNVARDTVESKAKRQQKVGMNEHKKNTTDIKSKRSPYEQRFDAKPKLARNLKKTLLIKKDSTTSSARVLNLQRKVKTVAADVNSLQQKTVFEHDMKQENTQKFLQLLAEQQQEQERMLEVFALQRSQLLQELECHNKTEMPISINISQSVQPNSQPVTKKSPAASRKIKIKDHPRRKLFSSNFRSSTPCSTPLNSTGKEFSCTFEQKKRSLVIDENVLKEQAATKINACARGFLVRRLYRCEQTQRVVETIKDTLYFVINLHYENKENPEEAKSLTNKELKTRLLQQLLTASKTLHKIFFETSLKERLDIIARDRKILKMKLLAKESKKEIE